ncbi:MAG TPA: methanogenesis marker 9 domain-containing protein [Methanobacteriaceae archaeon]|jgi:putative methanogenesis marker domain 9|nr:methanogenesis marker 9 domain-containing protein [Euryarchaeota archaeon]HNR25103.1 methanogenesis marker 9 domain-containing protein [Methanobacteriaceae archaeon]HNS24898.1 methanogenesis marker 9 domain-containing protein [Methanobacteriaceae archaeon]
MAWADSPSHVCRGGDKRALTFCCPPVKPCPILHTLEDAKITPQEYVDIKEDFGRKTRLGHGEGTCFGSLVWCCKPSKPCPLRDMVMRRINMSNDEYLELKKELSEKLVGKTESSAEEKVKGLAEAFNVSEDEARQTLQECGNDLRMAMKLLQMKNLEQ